MRASRQTGCSSCCSSLAQTPDSRPFIGVACLSLCTYHFLIIFLANVFKENMVCDRPGYRPRCIFSWFLPCWSGLTDPRLWDDMENPLENPMVSGENYPTNPLTIPSSRDLQGFFWDLLRKNAFLFNKMLWDWENTTCRHVAPKSPSKNVRTTSWFFFNTESSFCFGWISVLDIWYCFFLGMFFFGGLDTIYIARFLMFLWTPGEKNVFFYVSAVNKSIFVVKSSFYPVQSPLSIAILCHTVN